MKRNRCTDYACANNDDVGFPFHTGLTGFSLVIMLSTVTFAEDAQAERIVHTQEVGH